MGARLRVVGPSTLVPRSLERLGVEVHRDMARGLDGADIVMMLRLQRERMSGALVPCSREYFHFFGLDQEKLAHARAGRAGDASRTDEQGRRDRFHPSPTGRGR